MFQISEIPNDVIEDLVGPRMIVVFVHHVALGDVCAYCPVQRIRFLARNTNVIGMSLDRVATCV